MLRFRPAHLAAIGILVGSTAWLLAGQPAHADYIDGNLIDDSKFIDSATMDQTAIQTFLNGKGGALASQRFATDGSTVMNSSCQPSNNCQTAAWIINYTAQHIGLNPRVIMATLQKEESLITDPSPNQSQYNYAMGYGCPDTSGCSDPGFYKQVVDGSWQLRFNYERAGGNNGTWTSPDNTTWGNGISYPCASGNPTSNSTQGDYFYDNGLMSGNTVGFYAGTTSSKYTTISLTNRATAALYCYTPHVYSSQYSGSYNFVISYESWWGETTGDGLIQTSDSPNVYLEWGDTYYLFPDYNTFLAYGEGGRAISTVNSSYLSSATQGPNLVRLVQYGSDPNIYLIDNGVRHRFPDWNTYLAVDPTGKAYTDYSNADLVNLLPAGADMSTIAQNPSNGYVYLIANGQKRYIPAESYGPYSSQPIVKLSADYLNGLTSGIPVLTDNWFIKSSSSPTVYFYNGGTMYPFSTSDDWVSWGQKLQCSGIPASEMSNIPTGGNMSRFFTDGSGNYYIADSTQKHTIQSSQVGAWGKTTGNFVTLPSNVISYLASGPAIANVIKGSSSSVYLVHNAKSMVFPTWSDLTGSGYNSASIVTVDNSTLGSLTFGSPAYAPGSRVETANGKVFWIDQGFIADYVPSMTVYAQFWPSFSGLRSQNDNNLADYSQPALSVQVHDPSNNYYLVDSATKHAADSTMISSSYYNFGAGTALSTTLLNSLGSSAALTKYIKGSGSTVYLVQNGQKRPFATWQAFTNNGGTAGQIVQLSNSYINSLATGSTLN